MNTLIKVLKNTQFLRYFNSDWARLMALALVLGAAILVAKSLTTWNVLIAGVLAIMVVVIKGIFEVAKHRVSGFY